jgi:NADH-quinone oxidoreductase subunit J
LHQVAFALTALLMAIGAIRLVTTKNVVRGALWLVIVLGGVAVTFLLFLAEFLAWTQVLIYIGAVIVLLLFGLMLTRAPIGRTALDNQNRGLAALVSGGIFLLTSVVLWNAFEGKTLRFEDPFSTAQLGQDLFTKFVLPFEVV